jgi:ribosomal protein L20
MNFTKAERISLKLHPELNEKWVQELIASRPKNPWLGLAAQKRKIVEFWVHRINSSENSATFNPGTMIAGLNCRKHLY